MTQDDQITQGFNVPFNSFGAQIALAMKARQNVTDARLHLDSWKQSLKTAENAGASAKLEQYRNDVEQAEDKLVASTEEAISLMKQVLENPEPIKSLSAFVKAYVPGPTLPFHAALLTDIFPLLPLIPAVKPSTTLLRPSCSRRCSRSWRSSPPRSRATTVSRAVDFTLAPHAHVWKPALFSARRPAATVRVGDASMCK